VIRLSFERRRGYCLERSGRGDKEEGGDEREEQEEGGGIKRIGRVVKRSEEEQFRVLNKGSMAVKTGDGAAACGWL